MDLQEYMTVTSNFDRHSHLIGLKIKKRILGLLKYVLAFFPTLHEHCILLQWNWLSWCIVHWSHPEYCLCWANTNACSIGYTSLWIEYKCFTSFPSFDWLYSQHIWTKSSTNLYTESTANTVLFANIGNYCDWHLIHWFRFISKLFKPYAICITVI
jgi:hypothetical protein